MDRLIIDNLEITFHRTVRVDMNKTSALPPSLGLFTLYPVKDYPCPAHFDPIGYFIAMHDKEAVWLMFTTATPHALIVGAGGVNALNGKPLGLKLAEDNYLVTPPQPWLDGWKADGTVYQFVATTMGEGKTVGEQLGKPQAGAIGLAVFASKEPLERKDFPEDTPVGSAFACYASAAPMEMGLGKGGQIEQKVYKDPYGLDKWQEEPKFVTAVYLVNAVQFKEMTGEEIPPLPPAAADYHGKWFEVHDDELPDMGKTEVFKDVKSVFPE